MAAGGGSDDVPGTLNLPQKKREKAAELLAQGGRVYAPRESAGVEVSLAAGGWLKICPRGSAG